MLDYPRPFLLYSSYQWFSAQCAKEGAAAAPSSLQETSPVAGASTSGSSSSSRHKKAKKQTSKGAKNADSEKHHPLTEGEKGAHKSSARSSHQVQVLLFKRPMKVSLFFITVYASGNINCDFV